MSWISFVSSIIAAALAARRQPRIEPPPGLAGARVSYVNQGRAGKVVFTSGFKSFEMYFEFGGGDTVATIDIPSAAEWSARTGFPLAMRPAILDFIGKTVVREQTTYGKGRFEVHDQYLSIPVGGVRADRAR